MSQRDVGKVNVNRHPEVPEGSPLPYPTHKVIGVMPNEDAAWQAIDELRSRGFADEEIELWGGEAGTETIHGTLERSGIKGLLRRLALEFGDSAETIRRHEEALRSGQFLLVAFAPTAEAKEAAHEAMDTRPFHYVLPSPHERDPVVLGANEHEREDAAQPPLRSIHLVTRRPAEIFGSPAMKLVFATLLRCSQRWSRVSINDLERSQLKLLRGG